MYMRRNAYYYVDRAGKWHPLGRDRIVALTKYPLFERARTGDGRTIGSLLDLYWAEYVPGLAKPLAPTTRTNYMRYTERLRKAYGPVAPEDVRRADVKRAYRQTTKKAFARNVFSFLKTLLALAVDEWEVLDRNPLDGIRFEGAVKPGKRYLEDEEIDRIKPFCTRPVQLAIDLAYLLSMRRSEVVAIKLGDIRNGHIHIDRGTSEPMVFRITPPVQAVIDECMKLKRSLREDRPQYLICHTNGRPYSAHSLSSAFTEARKAANIATGRFHDVRRKSATDEPETATARLGHKQEATTRRHYIARQKPVEPIKDR